jgi:hypothetical protein
VRNLGVAAAHDKVGSIRPRWEHAVNENVTIHVARGRGTKAVPERAALTSRCHSPPVYARRTDSLFVGRSVINTPPSSKFLQRHREPSKGPEAQNLF